MQTLRCTHLHPTHAHTIADSQLRDALNKASYLLDDAYAFMAKTLIRMLIVLIRL